VIDAPSVPVEALPPAVVAAVAVMAAPSVTPGAVIARASAPVEPAPSSAAIADDSSLELQQVARAERLLAADPAQALALARDAAARFPSGYVSEERAYVEIMALVALHRLDEARPHIARFLLDHPDSAFARRVREAARTASSTR
jgi:hypothetical protein